MGVWDWRWLFLGEFTREVVAVATVAAMALRWLLAEDGRRGREEIGARLTIELRTVGWVAGTWRSDETWMIAGWGRGGVEDGGDEGEAATAVTARRGGGGGDSAGSGGGEEGGDVDGECGRDGDREEDGEAYDGAGATEEAAEGRGDRVDGEGMVAGRPGGCAMTRSHTDEGEGGEMGAGTERTKRFWQQREANCIRAWDDDFV